MRLVQSSLSPRQFAQGVSSSLVDSDVVMRFVESFVEGWFPLAYVGAVEKKEVKSATDEDEGTIKVGEHAIWAYLAEAILESRFFNIGTLPLVDILVREELPHSWTLARTVTVILQYGVVQNKRESESEDRNVQTNKCA